MAPIGWVKTDSILAGKREVVMWPDTAGSLSIANNIRVSIQKGLSAENYMNRVMAQLKEDYYYQNIATGKVKINNQTFCWERHYLQLQKRDYVVEQKCYFVGGLGQIYMIVCTAGVNEMSTLQPYIDTVLTTFKIADQ